MNEVAPPLNNGRYRLLEELGRGGAAVVYRAWDENLSMPRAIKKLTPQMTASKKMCHRFLQEARAMARLEHKNIVQIFDIGADRSGMYLVMELIEGGNLYERVDRHGPIDPAQAVRWMCDVLAAIELAHGNGIVHRDVKPHNILVDRHGEAKLTDFGIAHLGDDGHGLTRTGTALGTVAYMAPEQRVDASSVTPAADVYAAGATLYALITGRTPVSLFTTESHKEALSGVDPALREVIVRSCRFWPKERYPSARDMAAALDGCLARLTAGGDADLTVHRPRLSEANTIHEAPPAVPSKPAAPMTYQDTGSDAYDDFFSGEPSQVAAPLADEEPERERPIPWWMLMAAIGLLGVGVGVGVAIWMEPPAPQGPTASLAELGDVAPPEPEIEEPEVAAAPAREPDPAPVQPSVAAPRPTLDDEAPEAMVVDEPEPEPERVTVTVPAARQVIVVPIAEPEPEPEPIVADVDPWGATAVAQTRPTPTKRVTQPTPTTRTKTTPAAVQPQTKPKPNYGRQTSVGYGRLCAFRPEDDEQPGKPVFVYLNYVELGPLKAGHWFCRGVNAGTHTVYTPEQAGSREKKPVHAAGARLSLEIPHNGAGYAEIRAGGTVTMRSATLGAMDRSTGVRASWDR